MYKNYIRQLAKTFYWQLLYSRSKEIANINLFQNKEDFTLLQIDFLYWLEVYHSLELDLAMKAPNISRAVINSDIRTDAYLYWKSQQEKKNKVKIDNQTDKKVDINSPIPSMVFRGK